MKSDLKKLNALAVQMHGRRIGVINRLAGDRHLFSFEQDYIDDPNRPTLSLSFKGDAGGLVTATRPVGRRVPPFFSNLLPEGHLRAYLAEQAGVKPEREFFLLAVLGDDLPGAVSRHASRPAVDAGDHHDDDDEHHDDDRGHDARAAVFTGRRAAEVFRRDGGVRRTDHSGQRHGRVLDRQAALGPLSRRP